MKINSYFFFIYIDYEQYLDENGMRKNEHDLKPSLIKTTLPSNSTSTSPPTEISKDEIIHIEEIIKNVKNICILLQ